MKSKLIYKWDKKSASNIKRNIELNDETLRDGLQGTYVKHPSISQKKNFLELSDKLGLDSINIGFPISGNQAKNDIITLAKFAKKEKLKIQLECGGRILQSDIDAMIDVSQKSGVKLLAGLFIASSKIRHLVEKWDLKNMGDLIQKNIAYAIKNDLEVMFVSEDTSRAHPKAISYLYNKALEGGARRLCICDTVGEATPESTYNLVNFVKKNIVKNHKNVKIDWHGHNDRGLATANSLSAIKAGADCIQVTALGIGERTGNASTEEILINLHKEGLTNANLKYLQQYSELASKMLKFKISPNTPVIGKDIFKTATGVHASAIKKALDLNDHYLANNIYTSISPYEIGREHEILIGPNSGKSNVEFFLKKINIKPNNQLIEVILEKARIKRKILSAEEIIVIVNSEN